jgi:acetolactate synthase I/II/III large subunit
VEGNSLRVVFETDKETVKAEGTVRGNKLSWAMTLLGTAPECEVVVENDELLGEALIGGRPGASLDGTRVGSKAQIRSREGSEAVVDTLIACGVEYVFGYSGGPNSSLTRSVARIPNIPGRNELSAAWMSYGYNRSKNRAASAAVLYAVGVLHASPVIHAAKVDSTPLLVLFVESSAAWDARDILQPGHDMFPTLAPISKYIKRVVDGEDLPILVRQAVTASSTGKYGAAVLDLTHLAMLERTTVKTESLVLPLPPAASEDGVRQAAELIRAAKSPVILAGAGVHFANARAELRQFAEATGIPVVTSGPGGRGVLPDDHPLYAGDMTGWGAFPTGMRLSQGADLWIAVGFSFSQTATSSWSVPKPERVIHVDIEESQIGRIFEPTLGMVADAKAFFSQLTDYFVASGGVNFADSPRIEEIDEAKKKFFDLLSSFTGDPIMPAGVGQLLAEEVPAGTILVGDEGFMVSGMLYRSSKYPDGFAPPMGFHYASLGSTLPVAIGAKFANPDRLVVSVGGDAGFYYDCADLSILAEHNLKVLVILYNNGGLYGGPKARSGGFNQLWLDLPDTDYAGVARSFGVPSERIEHASDLESAVRRAIAADGPYFLEVVVGAGSGHINAIGRTGEHAPPKFGHGDRHIAGSWPN